MEMQTHRSVFILLDLSKKKKRLLEVFLGHGGELERVGSSSQLSSVLQLASGGWHVPTVRWSATGTSTGGATATATATWGPRVTGSHLILIPCVTVRAE